MAMSDLHHENVVVNTNIGIRFWRSEDPNHGYVPFHWHSSIEIVCVLKGKVIFSINGQRFEIGPNEFIMVPSGIVHAVANEPNTAYVLQIPLNAVKPYIAHPERAIFRNGNIHSTAYQRAVQLIQELGFLQTRHPDGYLFDTQIVFVQLLKTMFLKLSDPQKEMPKDDNIKQLIIYINDHHNEKLTVASLARHFGYNANYLSRLFSNKMGISLIHYIYLVKLNQLYFDLLHTATPVEQLFQQNGLTNPRTARQLFREMFGMLPNQLRQKQK